MWSTGFQVRRFVRSDRIVGNGVLGELFGSPMPEALIEWLLEMKDYFELLSDIISGSRSRFAEPVP